MDVPHFYPNSELHNQSYEKPRTSYVRDNIQKDQICRNFWSSGYCNYGDICKFVHVSSDIGSNAVNSSSWQEHNRTGKTNESNSQRTICKYFSRGRNCPYDRCTFVHKRTQMSEEKREMTREISAISIQTVETRDTVDSRTNHQLKTKLCIRWRGDNTCPYGDKCTYAHGRAELRRGIFNLPSEHKNFSTTSRSINKNDLASNSVEQTAPADKRVPPKPKVCPFKWNNRKIVGVYADWIDEDSPEPSSSRRQQYGYFHQS